MRGRVLYKSGECIKVCGAESLKLLVFVFLINIGSLSLLSELSDG